MASLLLLALILALGWYIVTHLHFSHVPTDTDKVGWEDVE